MRRLRLAILTVAVAGAVFGAGAFPIPVEAVEGPEWQHALWTAAQLRTHPPEAPVAVLLGGSCAREATVDDVSWAADVQRLGGDHVATYNLGSRRQTFEQDIALVKALPEIPMIVFIGLNAGRFAASLTTTTDTTPPETKPTWVRHHYRAAKIWSPERKQERVRFWLDHRLGVFNERFTDHAAQLDRLIDTCVRRGYTPVLLALPRNLVAVDHAFDEPVGVYLAAGQRLARKHGVAFVDFVPELQLTDDDFFDLNHLVARGREAYQARLAFETACLLAAGQPAAEAGGASSQPAAGSAPLQPPVEAPGRQPAAPGRSKGALWPMAFGIVLLGVALVALRRRVVVRRARARRRHLSGPRANNADRRQRPDSPI